MDCGCRCDCERRVRVKLKIHGARWITTLSYDAADAARREVSRFFENKEVDIADGNSILVETMQNDVTKTFEVIRSDVTMLDARDLICLKLKD